MVGGQIQGDRETDRLFFALSDATRRDIVTQTLDREHSVSELGRLYPITLTAVRKHVKAADWRREAMTLRRVHRLTQDWPQRPGWRSSTDLLHAEIGTRIDLGAMPPEGVARCRAAWARLVGRQTSDVRRPRRPSTASGTSA